MLKSIDESLDHIKGRKANYGNILGKNYEKVFRKFSWNFLKNYRLQFRIICAKIFEFYENMVQTVKIYEVLLRKFLENF